MKSYSVKSNAKRFARGIAAKYPDVEAAEPEPAANAGEWFPAVLVTGKLSPEAKNEIYSAAIVHGVFRPAADPFDHLMPADPVEDAGSIETVFGGKQSGKTAVVNGVVDKMLDEGKTVITMSGGHAVEVRGAGVAKDITPADMARVAASLPPPVKSSREEIDARRAERRQRIDAEKAEGTRTATGAKIKINKTKVILDLVSRSNGATQTELEAATGWQRHTLRGYIAGTLRKRLAPAGKAIECRRAKGQETRYVLVDVKGGEA